MRQTIDCKKLKFTVVSFQKFAMMPLVAFNHFDSQLFVMMDKKSEAFVHSNIIRGFPEIRFYTLSVCTHLPAGEDLIPPLKNKVANLYDKSSKISASSKKIVIQW